MWFLILRYGGWDLFLPCFFVMVFTGDKGKTRRAVADCELTIVTWLWMSGLTMEACLGVHGTFFPHILIPLNLFSLHYNELYSFSFRHDVFLLSLLSFFTLSVYGL